MKVKFRRSCQQDIEQIYELHTKCFSKADQWYKTAIRHYLDNGIVVEICNNNNNKIIGVLLQGSIIPCNQKINSDELNDNMFNDFNDFKSELNNYKEDIFEPLNENGQIFFKNNNHFIGHYGIVMLCVDPNHRGKGLGKILILKHWKDNKGKLVCLHTRKSNINAFMLYKSMGYEHIAYIKNKYFLPTEDSIFMIKILDN